MNQFAVLIPSKEERHDAQVLAESLCLPLIDDENDATFSLIRQGRLWGIYCRELPGLKPLVIDFSQGSWKRRREQLKGPGDILSRALGKVKGRQAVDATAGLGRDSLHLLALGFQVVAIERSKILAYLLRQAKKEGLSEEGESSDLQFLEIIHSDARCYLRKLYDRGEAPDVVFLDPMFPQKKRSSLSGKEMQLFHRLFSYEPKIERELLQTALEVVEDRVVVKRPSKAPPIMRGARHQYEGKSVRYDVYFPGDKLEIVEEKL